MSATPAGIYVRISQDRTGLGAGVERQETECRALAERLGWDVVDVYCDNDISAYSGKVRPAYQKMLADVESGRIRGLLAWHPDRLHRKFSELESFINFVERTNLQIHTVSAGDFNLSTSSGRAVARTIGAWATQESEHKSERIAAARKQAALAGKHHGGTRPYGYEKDGVTPRPDEIAEINKAVDQLLAGVSLRSVVRDLHLRGVPNAGGGTRWDSARLRQLLRSPRIAGLSTYRGEIVGKAVWPAAVSEERWRAVCAVLDNPARRTNQKGGTIKWLGSGIYVCGVCGARDLRVSSSTNGRKVYRCRNRIAGDNSRHVGRDAQPLDSYVEATAVARLTQPSFLQALTVSTDTGVDVESLRVERIELSERLDSLVLMHLDGKLTTRQLEVATAAAQTRIAEIEKLSMAEVSTGPFAELVGVQDIREKWFGTDDKPALALGLRRQIVDALMTVTVLPASPGREFRPDRIQIDWKV